MRNPVDLWARRGSPGEREVVLQLSTLSDLRAEVERRGWMTKRPGRILLELVFHVAVTLSGVALFAVAAPWPLKFLGLVICTVGSMGVATNSHTASHGGTSDSPVVNTALTLFGYPLFLGLSASYWRFTHVVRHHPAPNVHGVDGDCDLMPWFAMNEKELEGVGRLRLFFYRHLQWYVFPLALCFNDPQFQISGWKYLLRKLRSDERSGVHVLDLLALFAHWSAWVFVPMLFFDVTSVLLFTALRIATLGYGMFVVLAPGHYPAEAIVVGKGHGETDHLRRQCATSLNFRSGPVGWLFTSGLEYQIEHHLFQGLSHVQYRKMSGLVREFCERNGYPYQVLGWGEAVWKSLYVFRRPKPVVTFAESAAAAAASAATAAAAAAAAAEGDGPAVA